MLVKHVAISDGYSVAIRMEQEPGSSGVIVVDHYARNVLKGYDYKGIKSTGSKAIRANPVSSAAEGGRVYIVRATWNSDFFDELEAFPFVEHDDQVDGLSGAFTELRTLPVSDAIPLEVEDENGSYWMDDLIYEYE
jgi:predicted phage terminase large subunit-like protein